MGIFREALFCLLYKVFRFILETRKAIDTYLAQIMVVL